MSKREEYLNKIRELDGLKNAILYSISVTKRTRVVEFSLITDQTYTAVEERFANEITQSFVPNGFTATVKLIRRVPDAEMIRLKIFAYISSTFPAAAAFMKEDRIDVEMLSSGAQFYVAIAAGEQSLFNANQILDEVSAYLSSIFALISSLSVFSYISMISYATSSTTWTEPENTSRTILSPPSL